MDLFWFRKKCYMKEQKIKQDDIKIGENIRNVRTQKGYGQTELVRMLQLHHERNTREN